MCVLQQINKHISALKKKKTLDSEKPAGRVTNDLLFIYSTPLWNNSRVTSFGNDRQADPIFVHVYFPDLT